MNVSIRTTKTASGKTAVQVVRYRNRKVVVLKHMGSAETQEDVAILKQKAERYRDTVQQGLFPEPRRMLVDIHDLSLQKVTYTYARSILLQTLEHIGFNTVETPLLYDLALMRVIEPTSKLRTLELLQRYFGIDYAERTLYRTLKKFALHKESAERVVLTYAQKHHTKDLSLVLYDVTTLYFESFESDELRVPGFSKDSKSQQPQIVVGLLVTRDGFPIGYEVFKGNTFEGRTMLPVFNAFVKRHKVNIPVIVADAAMLSRTNLQTLTEQGYRYIVGARLANLSPKIIAHIATTVPKQDGAQTRMATEHGDLIVAFSSAREKKNRRDMEKQLVKAEAFIERGEVGKRAKFVSGTGIQPTLNSALKKKTETLLGMKGYSTNIPETELSNIEIIARYGDLWNVEASFRMSKSDLATRPIFHYTEDAVRAHMVIAFIALALGRCIERLFGASLRKFKDVVWSVTDAHLRDGESGKSIALRTAVPKDMKDFQKLVVDK